MDETLGIIGSGTIACGLAAAAADHGEVVLWARSDASADRARGKVDKACGGENGVKVVTDIEAVTGASFVVEAGAEGPGGKRPGPEQGAPGAGGNARRAPPTPPPKA